MKSLQRKLEFACDVKIYEKKVRNYGIEECDTSDQFKLKIVQKSQPFDSVSVVR